MQRMIFHILLAVLVGPSLLGELFNIPLMRVDGAKVEENVDMIIPYYTSAYSLAWNDGGSGGKRDGSLYVPRAPSRYELVGTVAVAGYTAPYKPVILIDPSTPTSVATRAYRFYRVYADSGTGARMDGSVWRPECPPGFYSVSDFGQSGYSWPGNIYRSRTIRPCLVARCVVSCSTYSIWDDRGTGGSQDITFWGLRGCNPRLGQDVGFSGAFFRATSDYNYGPTGYMANCINPKCVRGAQESIAT